MEGILLLQNVGRKKRPEDTTLHLLLHYTIHCTNYTVDMQQM